MKGAAFYFSTFQRLLNESRAQSLWYLSVLGGCCADELLNTKGCRYDLERFGCLEQSNPRHADLLFVSGAVSHKAAPHLKELYEQMLFPRYVIALGSCALSGGLFSSQLGGNAISGVESLIPVDVCVPGCPPRPEAIMNGLIALQEKMSGAKWGVHADSR